MLVLIRNFNEEIIPMDNRMVFKLVDLERGKVRIGINAAPNIKVHKNEIYEIIQKSKHDEIFREKKNLLNCTIISN